MRWRFYDKLCIRLDMMETLFYEYDRASETVTPTVVALKPNTMRDRVPKDWWCYNLLQEVGAQKFIELVATVKFIAEIVNYNEPDQGHSDDLRVHGGDRVSCNP